MNSESRNKITFLGDISLNDNYISYHKENINPFSNLEPLLLQPDYVVGNLECLVKGDKGENELKKPRLTTTLETLNYLKNINLSVACLAQNHIYDHLESGFIKTTQFLTDHHIQYLGASVHTKEYDHPVILDKNGIKVGLLNYVTKDTNPNPPENIDIYLNMFTIDKALNDIEKLKPLVNHLVLILHWGGRVEGGMYPDWHQPRLAHKLIDAGADIIIGHHSHTFQPFEIYKGKYIFYSLGNFCFSDYTFEGVFNPMPLQRRITSIVEVSFCHETYNVVLHFYRNDGTSFIPLNKYLQQAKSRNNIFKYLFRFKLIWNLYYFHKIYLLPFSLFFERKDLSIDVKFNRLRSSLYKRVKKMLTSI